MSDISKVDELKTSIFCSREAPQKSIKRCGGDSRHFIIRMEPGEMNRGVCPEFFNDPLAEFRYFVCGIIVTRDNKIR